MIRPGGEAIAFGLCGPIRSFHAPSIVLGVIWVGSHDARGEFDLAESETVEHRDYSEPLDRSRPLAGERRARGGLLPAPWGAWQSVLLPVFGILVVGIAGLVRLFRPAPSPPAMTAARTWVVTAVMAAAYMLVLQWGLGTLVTSVAPELIGSDQDAFREMAAGDATDIALLVVRVVITAAIWEEILFRGLLFAGLARRWGFWPARSSRRCCSRRSMP